MPPHPLNNFELQRYRNEPRYNCVYSHHNLPSKTKDGVYVINLDEYPGIGTQTIIQTIIQRPILTALELNKFRKKLNYLLATKTTQQTFREHKPSFQ